MWVLLCLVLHKRTLWLIPTDLQQCAWLYGDRGPLLPQALPMTLSVTLVRDFPSLHGSVVAVVRTLIVNIPETFHFNPTGEILHAVPVFPNVVQLEILNESGNHVSTDMRVVAAAMPQLEGLRIQSVTLTHKDIMPAMQMLRRLKIKSLEVDIAALVAACPRLVELETEWTLSFDVGQVADWPPLKTLQLACWYKIPLDLLIRSIEQTHFGTLERLALRNIRSNAVDGPWPQLNVRALGERRSPLRELEVPLPMLMKHWASLASLCHLRILRLVNSHNWVSHEGMQLDDTSPLLCMPLLEELSFGLSRAATNCRALRGLTNLRIIYMTDGWVRDFINHTPRLERLHCDEILRSPAENRTFHERVDDGDHPPHLLCFREADIGFQHGGGASVLLNAYTFELLAQASVVSVTKRVIAAETMRRLSLLPKLVSLEVSEEPNPGGDNTRWPVPLASLQTIETIRFRRYDDSVGALPWDLYGADRLTMLHIMNPRQDTVDAIGRWAATLVSLEEVDLVAFEGDSIGPLALLPRLRCVRIPHWAHCGPLRDAIQDGRLTTLQLLIHGGDDCLSSVDCRFHNGY